MTTLRLYAFHRRGGKSRRAALRLAFEAIQRGRLFSTNPTSK